MSSTNSPLPAALPEAYNNPEAAIALMAIMNSEAGALSWQGQGPQSTPSPAATETARRWKDELFGGRLPKLTPSDLSPSHDVSQPDPACDSPAAWLPR